MVFKNKKPLVRNGRIVIKISLNKMIGKVGQSFSLKRLNGNLFKYSIPAKKITVLNFWYVGCVPCEAERESLNKIVEKYKNNKYVEFVAVTFVAGVTEAMPQLISYLKKNNFSFQITIASRRVLKEFKIRASYPRTIVLGKDGKIRFNSNLVDTPPDVRNKEAKWLDKIIRKELAKYKVFEK